MLMGIESASHFYRAVPATLNEVWRLVLVGIQDQLDLIVVDDLHASPASGLEMGRSVSQHAPDLVRRLYNSSTAVVISAATRRSIGIGGSAIPQALTYLSALALGLDYLPQEGQHRIVVQKNRMGQTGQDTIFRMPLRRADATFVKVEAPSFWDHLLED
jgi:hypothetical protein